jgi:hypothetical protein
MKNILLNPGATNTNASVKLWSRGDLDSGDYTYSSRPI